MYLFLTNLFTLLPEYIVKYGAVTSAAAEPTFTIKPLFLTIIVCRMIEVIIAVDNMLTLITFFICSSLCLLNASALSMNIPTLFTGTYYWMDISENIFLVLIFEGNVTQTTTVSVNLTFFLPIPRYVIMRNI